MTNDDYKKEIGKRIAKARRGKAWTLQDLADKSKLSRSAIGNYESGTRMPGPAEINALAMVLGASGAYLMCLEDAKPQFDVVDLPAVFQDAVRVHIARYKEVASKLPVSVLQMFQRPTSENYAEWEQAIETSYRMFTNPPTSAMEEDAAAWQQHKKNAEEILGRNKLLQKTTAGKK